MFIVYIYSFIDKVLGHHGAEELVTSRNSVSPVIDSYPNMTDSEFHPGFSLAPELDRISSGISWQLLKALKALSGGDRCVIEYKLNCTLQAECRDAMLDELKKKDNWIRHDNGTIIPLVVPGTLFPAVVGNRLLEFCLIEPIEEPHWVPNLRFYELTEKGAEVLKLCAKRWKDLPWGTKVKLCLIE